MDAMILIMQRCFVGVESRRDPCWVSYIILEGIGVLLCFRWTVILWVGFVLLATSATPIVLALFCCLSACVPLSVLSFLLEVCCCAMLVLEVVISLQQEAFKGPDSSCANKECFYQRGWWQSKYRVSIYTACSTNLLCAIVLKVQYVVRAVCRFIDYW